MFGILLRLIEKLAFHLFLPKHWVERENSGFWEWHASSSFRSVLLNRDKAKTNSKLAFLVSVIMEERRVELNRSFNKENTCQTRPDAKSCFSWLLDSSRCIEENQIFFHKNFLQFLFLKEPDCSHETRTTI